MNAAGIFKRNKDIFNLQYNTVHVRVYLYVDILAMVISKSKHERAMPMPYQEVSTNGALHCQERMCRVYVPTCYNLPRN